MLKPQALGEAAYLLANGASKARGDKTGGAKDIRTWRLLFLSSGENDLEHFLSLASETPTGGQEARIIDVHCSDSGIIQNCPGLGNTRLTVEHLERQAKTHNGHAIRAFLTRLVSTERAYVRALHDEFLHRLNLPPNVNSQVFRVAKKFAVIAVAGYLAADWGIVPWPQLEAFHVCGRFFGEWLQRRGHVGASEAHRGINSVLDFIGRYGESRFDEPTRDDKRMILNRAGSRFFVSDSGEFDYYFTPTGFAEACGGLNPKQVSKTLVEAGLITPDSAGKASVVHRIAVHGLGRYYVLTAENVERYRQSQEQHQDDSNVQLLRTKTV
jgi:putative DNA primase/helicase